MLQLVLGAAGTGKSTWLMDAIGGRARAGHKSILLVPEQFSSSAEGEAWQALGERDSGLVEVLSFRTLAQRILRTCGGAGTQVLGDAGQVVYVRRALDAVGEKLQAFARQRRSTAFCNLCAQTISELKTAGADAAALLRVGEAEKDDKFKELAMILEAYEAQIEGSAMDPQDLLSLAATKADCGYFDGKACFIDSFDGFTAPEYRLIAEVMASCEALTVGLCCDGLSSGAAQPALFAPVRRTAHRLIDMAARAGLKASAPVVLQRLHRPQTAGLAAVNHILALGEGERQPAEGVFFTAAQDEWEEVGMAAAEMHRLALAGVPYSRMALICRDTAQYQRVVQRVLPLYDIPFFYDQPDTIEYTAPVAFLRAALAILQRGLSSPEILALLKTGLCGYTDGDIASLENYVYTWEPRAAQWQQPFDRHPGGLLQEMDEEATARLEAAERLRAGVAPVLEDFRRKARGGGARGLSRSLYLLMDRFDAASHAEAMAAQMLAEGEFAFADQCRRAWDLAMDLLDQMAALLGDEKVTAAEYDDLLLILVRATDFGQTPQTLECAVFTGADRMRLFRPDYCFVLGLCQGEFPREVGYSGLLTHNDRDALVRAGVEMPGSFENRTMLEEMFFYKALCAPAQGLYLSWPRRHSGEGRAQSAALQPVLDALAPPALALDAAQLAATPAAAYDLLGLEYRGNTPLAASLYQALESLPDMADKLELLRRVDNPGDFFVKDAALVRRLVGREMTLSATTAEQFYKCPFSYFMERVLRVRPRRKAEVSPMESGTFVHYILEQVLREAGENFAQTPDQPLLAMTARHAEDFIRENLPDDTRRTARRLAQITDTCARLVLFMRDAAAQSRFSIDALELAIGDEEGAVPPLEVETADGQKVRVVGKVDRVDTLDMDGKTYLCIVDYKTGNKDFRLDELDYGNNIQMIIYMGALCENAGDRYPNAAPAGVLYLGSDPSPRLGGREGTGKSAFKLNGLLLSDTSVLDALDSRENGSFLPVRFTKDGAPHKSSPVADAAVFDDTIGTVRGLLADMARQVYDGSFPARPLVKGQARPCTYCAYRAACRHEDGQNETQMEKREVEE